MIEELQFPGALLIRSPEFGDGRGWFRKLAELTELADAGLDTRVQQVALAHNDERGTIRGLHYQAGPEPECKYVWCVKGSLVDILVDLRPTQPTFGRWTSVRLSADDPAGVYIPSGIAHGYQSTQDHTTVLYLLTSPHRPEAARTLRWNDPAIAVEWPLPLTAISPKDAEAPLWPPQY